MTSRNKKGQFEQGCSGNKTGKPKGARNKVTLAALDLLAGESEALTRKAVALALEGDTVALRLCLERIAPPSKEKPLEGIALPELGSATNVLAAYECIANSLANGELLPSEAKLLCSIFDSYLKLYEVEELETRIIELEVRVGVRAKS